MNFENFKKENQEYIQVKVNPFFESLLYDLLINKPEDIVLNKPLPKQLKILGRIHHSMVKNQRRQTFSNLSHCQLLIFLAKIKAMTRKPTVTKKEENGKKQAVSSEEDDDEEVEDLPSQKKNSVTKKPNQRSSVSAEAYGNFNKKGNFKARVIPKSEEQKRRIQERLSKAFMFQALDEKESEIVINAMEEKKFMFLIETL